MLGKTNATTGGSGGGAGDTVTAINKTGAVINEGDKVWLQKDAQVGDTGYTVVQNQYSLSGTASFVTRSGKYAFADINSSRGLYKLSETGATKEKTLSVNITGTYIRYMKDSAIFVTDFYNTPHRADDNGFFQIGKYHAIIDDLFIDNSNNLHRLNLDTGEVLKTWAKTSGFSFSENMFIMGNKAYLYNKYVTIEEDGTVSGTTTVSGLPSSMPVCGVTSDNRYVVLCQKNRLDNPAALTIYEAVNETTFRFVQAAELPKEFEPFYNRASNVIAIFNPYTGILTCTVTGSNKKYLIAKYENGSWKVLSVVLPLGTAIYPIINQGITVSDDLTKVGLTTLSQSAYGGYYAFQVVNTSTVAGFSGIPYNVYSFTNKTLTGKAKTSAEIGAEVEVSTVLPNEVSVEVTAEDDGVTLSME